MPDKPPPPTDLRALRRREERRLAFGVIAFLVIVGGALIGLIYGWRAAILGEVCLLGGAALIGLLWLLLGLLGRWSGHA